MFYTYDTVFCPSCPPVFHRVDRREQVGPVLECVESNYSGCCTDIGKCLKCGKTFSVSFKVDTIEEIQS
ncbi:MAG: hypothetical protein ACYSWO_30060 [Planctomycetota bacterium]|jgi:hypothetical protein